MRGKWLQRFVGKRKGGGKTNKISWIDFAKILINFINSFVQIVCIAYIRVSLRS